MPKIVDHDAHRAELARRAAGLFSQHGYSGLGMRRIAQELGMSKSALYHYFPSKRDLFLACTAAAVLPEPDATGEAARTGTPANRLMALAIDLRAEFAAEMSLLLDYVRGMDAAAIARDAAMQLALERFLARVGRITGPERAHGALALVIGGLTLDHASGGTMPIEDLHAALARLLDQKG